MRIVVVEDEYMIRCGVAKLVSKISPEYEVVGEAENGVDGIEVITRLKPDLVIVDIKMPQMDGIEMLAQLKSKGVKHRTVILSGYSEFEYAQKAIKMGVCEYLLKPITASDLEQTLKNVEKEISMEKQLGTDQQVLNSLESLFQSLVLSDSNCVDEMYKYIHEKYDIDSNGEFAAVSIYFSVHTKVTKDRIIKSLSALLDHCQPTRYSIFELKLHHELVMVFYNCLDFEALERYLQVVVIKEIVKEGIHDIAFAWMRFSGLEFLRNSLNILRKELRWSIVLGEDVLISYPKTQQINTRLIQYPIDIETSAKSAVCSFDVIKLKRHFEDFLSWWRKELYQPSGITEAFIRFASSIINVIREIDYDIYVDINQKDTLQKIMDAVTWNELRNALTVIADRISSFKKKNNPAVGLVIKKMLSIVKEHYKDGISLDEIATRLNITPEYLGSLFNKEVGVNFSSYLKDFRIKKAKELLIGTDLKTYEIAVNVGYQDPKYFCRVFKEATGLTPGDYQKAYK
jgi:two-component system, response regulator YesN